jgi:hypothetical protein
MGDLLGHQWGHAWPPADTASAISGAITMAIDTAPLAVTVPRLGTWNGECDSVRRPRMNGADDNHHRARWSSTARIYGPPSAIRRPARLQATDVLEDGGYSGQGLRGYARR